MRVRRCNAKCYDAKGRDCNCYCNGVNHGVGAQQARENMRKLGLTWGAAARRVRCHRSRKRTAPLEQGLLFSALQESSS